MRAVISRVLSASVTVDAAVVAELRLLRAERSVLDAGASVLVVSQFTLYGDTRKGRRPSWSGAAHPEIASPLVDAVLTALRARGVRTLCGRFGAEMAVTSVNDGPFTVLVDT